MNLSSGYVIKQARSASVHVDRNMKFSMVCPSVRLAHSSGVGWGRIFQCLHFTSSINHDPILITCSGGSFAGYTMRAEGPRGITINPRTLECGISLI